MKKIILIGSGGHAKSCVDVIEMEKKFKIVGFVDKNSKKLLGYKKIGILLNLLFSAECYYFREK